VKGWRTIVLLLLVLCGLGAYLFFKGDRQGTNPRTAERALKGYRFLEAHEIVIWPRPRQETEAIKIVRTRDSGYWVREPLRDKASLALLQNLQEVFDSAVLLEGYDAAVLKRQPDLVAQCGLEQPVRTIQLRFGAGSEGGGGGEVITLEMGNDAPMGDGVYVRRGETIYRCPNTAPRTALNIQADDARERVLVDRQVMSMLKVSRVTYRTGGTVSELELTRNHLGEFWITKPGNMRADQGVVTNYLSILQGLTASAFLSGGVDSVIGPSQEPTFHVVLESERGTEDIKIYTQATAGPPRYWGYHARRNMAFEITLKDGLRALQAKADLLRARLLLPIRREDMVRILLEPGGSQPKIDLRIGMGQVFRMHAPRISNLDPSSLSELLHGLTTMQVMEFLDNADPEEHGLGAGAFRVSVQENRTRQTIALRLGKNDGEFTYVMREDESYIAKVPRASADKVRGRSPDHQRWVDFLELRVTDLKLHSFRLEVTGDGKTGFVYRKVGREWRADGSQEPDPEVGELVEDHLPNLQARRALTPPDDLGSPLFLRLLRPNTDSDVLLELRAWLHGGVVLVGTDLAKGGPGGSAAPRAVYEVNNSLLKRLLERWSRGE